MELAASNSFPAGLPCWASLLGFPCSSWTPFTSNKWNNYRQLFILRVLQMFSFWLFVLSCSVHQRGPVLFKSKGQSYDIAQSQLNLYNYRSYVCKVCALFWAWDENSTVDHILQVKISKSVGYLHYLQELQELQSLLVPTPTPLQAASHGLVSCSGIWQSSALSLQSSLRDEEDLVLPLAFANFHMENECLPSSDAAKNTNAGLEQNVQNQDKEASSR